MNLTYEKCGDYLIPNLIPDPEPEGELRKFGLMRKSYCLYTGVKTLAFQAKPLGQPHISRFRKKKCRDTKLEVRKWKTIENQPIARMISNTILYG